MWDFVMQNYNLLYVCELVVCGFRVIGGDITCTSNIFKTRPRNYDIHIFCLDHFWIILKFIK